MFSFLFHTIMQVHVYFFQTEAIAGVLLSAGFDPVQPLQKLKWGKKNYCLFPQGRGFMLTFNPNLNSHFLGSVSCMWAKQHKGTVTESSIALRRPFHWQTLVKVCS